MSLYSEICNNKVIDLKYSVEFFGIIRYLILMGGVNDEFI